MCVNFHRTRPLFSYFCQKCQFRFYLKTRAICDKIKVTKDTEVHVNKKPIFFLIFKIIGFLGIGAAIYGFYLSASGFGDFESNNFMVGGLLATFGLFVGVSTLVIGFRPEISKMTTKGTRYIMEENKDDLSAVATTGAEIASDAVAKTASAVKDGLSEEKKYCKHCGAKIDSDSKFCSSCGKEQ